MWVVVLGRSKCLGAGNLMLFLLHKAIESPNIVKWNPDKGL